MRLSDIVSLAKKYLLFGTITAIIICLTLIFIYFVIYKKLLKGKKILTPLKMFLVGIFICYLTVVLGAVFLVRENVGAAYHSINLPLFGQYKEAWHKWSVLEWRNIIFNILMFVPLGILLPLIFDKFKSLWKTVCIGFAFTVFIESVQFIFHLGIADTDDIIGNTLGVLIGYGFVMAVLTISGKTQNKPAKFIGYISPLLVTVLIFTIIFTAYNIQEFGNLPDNYYFRQKMNGVNISCAIELTDNKPPFRIYKSEIMDKDKARNFAGQFFDKIGTSFDNLREPELYDDCAFYYSANQQHLYIDYTNNSYKLTDFKNLFDVEKDSTATEEIIREKLAVDYQIVIPNDVEYTNQGNGDYTFISRIANISDDNSFIGEIKCSYYADCTIKNIHNSFVKCAFIRECEVISPQNAFKKIEKGDFYYNINEYGDLQSIEIVSFGLEYKHDSKGYFQPVYIFDSKINGNKINIIIPALSQ